MAICLGAAFIGALAAGCSRQQQVSPPAGLRPPAQGAPVQKTTTIRQIGSTTVLPLAEKWRTAFNKKYPNIEIAVSGGGSGTGIKALLSGGAEIANASRPMKEKEKAQAQEKGITPVEHVVAYDGIAVIVHPANSVSELSIEQLADIFTGNVMNWREIGGPDADTIIINRDSSSGTWEAFKEIALGGREYAPEALALASNQGVLASVAKATGSIGYVGLGYLNDSVKALKVAPAEGRDPVEPSVANVQLGVYPISRPLYCYTNGEPTGELGEYIQWIKGAGGQAIVAELGYVPVPE